MGFSKADFQAPAATLAAWQTTNFHFCTASPSAQLRATGAALSSLRGSAAETPSRAAAEGSSRHSPLSARCRPAPPAPGPRWPRSPAAGGPPSGQALEGDLHTARVALPPARRTKAATERPTSTAQPQPTEPRPRLPLKGHGRRRARRGPGPNDPSGCCPPGAATVSSHQCPGTCGSLVWKPWPSF